MSLFNPLSKQHKRLMEVFEGLPAMPVTQAAKLMRISHLAVPRNIEKMKKKGMFGQRQPFVHQGLKMLVLDESYMPFAYMCQEGDALLRDTRQAMSLLQDADSPTARQPQSGSLPPCQNVPA